MRYRLQRHDGTDCSATMVPITVLRMVPIQRYRHHKNQTSSQFNRYTSIKRQKHIFYVIVETYICYYGL